LGNLCLVIVIVTDKNCNISPLTFQQTLYYFYIVYSAHYHEVTHVTPTITLGYNVRLQYFT